MTLQLYHGSFYCLFLFVQQWSDSAVPHSCLLTARRFIHRGSEFHAHVSIWVQLNELAAQIRMQKVQKFLGFYPQLRGRGTQTFLTLSGGALQLPPCLARQQ